MVSDRAEFSYQTGTALLTVIFIATLATLPALVPSLMKAAAAKPKREA